MQQQSPPATRTAAALSSADGAHDPGILQAFGDRTQQALPGDPEGRPARAQARPSPSITLNDMPRRSQSDHFLRMGIISDGSAIAKPPRAATWVLKAKGK